MNQHPDSQQNIFARISTQLRTLARCFLKFVVPSVIERQEALLDAAFDGDLMLVNYLLKIGVNVNSRKDDGRTALGWAAQEGHMRIVKQLLAAGADVHLKDNEGWSPLILADSSLHYP